MSRIPEEVDRLLVFEKKLRQRKREEIREGMIDIIKHSVPNFIYPFLMIPTRWLVNKILKFLHSQGVVIKALDEDGNYWGGVEPLIELDN